MSPRPPRHFVIVVFDGARMLDVVGATEMLLDADGRDQGRTVSLVSVSGEDVTASIGFRIPVARAVAQVTLVDTVIVAGSTWLPRYPVAGELVAAVRALSRRARRTASIGTGSFVLAAAGLLDGSRATTDRRFVRELARRHPAVTVTRDQAVVAHGNVYTSAGANAGVEVARALLRDDGMLRYSQLGPVVEAVASDPAGRHTVQSLAELAHVSSRTLSRLFHHEFGTTPAKYVERARLEAAKHLLDAGHSITRAAERSGFGSSENLRRAFVTNLAESPSAYRKRSSQTASGRSV
jgi:transcriptional regulator GlxA family with amidase domain